MLLSKETECEIRTKPNHHRRQLARNPQPHTSPIPTGIAFEGEAWPSPPLLETAPDIDPRPRPPASTAGNSQHWKSLCHIAAWDDDVNGAFSWQAWQGSSTQHAENFPPVIDKSASHGKKLSPT